MSQEFTTDYHNPSEWSRHEPTTATAEALARVYSREVSVELPARPPMTAEQLDDMYPYVD